MSDPPLGQGDEWSPRAARFVTFVREVTGQLPLRSEVDTNESCILDHYATGQWFYVEAHPIRGIGWKGPVGLALVHKTEDRVKLETVQVLEFAKRQGVGTQLVLEAAKLWPGIVWTQSQASPAAWHDALVDAGIAERLEDGKLKALEQSDPRQAEFRRAARLLETSEAPATKKVFATAYADLDRRMAELAETDGDVYVPNPTPPGPVNYLLVCMEPSLGRWAKTVEEGREKVEAGFRNFLYSQEDFLLHFAAQRFLCAPEERYHVTDISKGAMLVERAGVERTERYERWHELLREELELLAVPGTKIIAVGKKVEEHLTQQYPDQSFTRVLHYSGQNARWWKEAIVGHEEEFAVFQESVHHRDVIESARAVMGEANYAVQFRDETLARLKKAELSESRKGLLFHYKLEFEALALA